MSRRLGLRSAATGAFLAVAVTVGLAGPASAAAEGGPVITIDSPREGQVFDSSSVTVSGSVAAAAPVGLGIYTLRNVNLTVGGQTFSIACSDSPCPFSKKVPLATNDRYKVTVSADQQSPIGAVVAAPSGARTVTFDVAAPPETPVLDPPKVTDGRTVELTWSRNVEPDMRYYAVFRRDPGASNFSRIGGNVAQPASGKTVTFTDTTTVFNGGAYAYLVAAVRRGALEGTEKSSAASAAVTATVPGAPTGSTPGPPGAPGTGPATPGAGLATPGATTVKAGPPAGVDLGGFLSSRSQPAALPPITVPEPPDTGFGSTLPFGARPDDDVEPGGDEAAVAPRRPSGAVVRAADARRPLVPVAAGLVLLVLAMHLRLLNRRLKPAGDLPLGPPLPEPRPAKRTVRALPAPPAVPQPVPPPRRPGSAPQERLAARETRPYDVVQEPDWAPRGYTKPHPLVAAEPHPVATQEQALGPQRQPGARRSPSARLQTAPGSERIIVGGRSSAPTPQPQRPAVAPPEPQSELAPVAVARSQSEPHGAGAAGAADVEEVGGEPDPDPEPEEFWTAEPSPPQRAAEPDLEPPSAAIEVFEVVSPRRRRLVRSSGR